MNESTKKSVKAGTSRTAAADRRKLFVEAYLRNGRNGTQAAIEAGYSPKGADVTACRLLGDAKVAALVADRTEQVLAEAQSTTERWLKETACAAYFDPARLYNPDGTLIPIHELPEDVRRAICSVDGIGDAPRFKIDKQAALLAIGRHHGVFEKDNQQRPEAVRVLVQLIG